ncbi:MAG TPA: CBM20 domain-containing protein [Myxococcaceae bacterium]|nr:CBM20 domain-containing protein [Myxococcaceae bacterium]
MQRHPSKSPLLLVLSLVTLAGCEPPPVNNNPTPDPIESTTTEIQFNVTVPPETPADATLFLVGSHQVLRGIDGRGVELVYQGGEQFSLKVRVPKEQGFTYRLQLFQGAEKQVALDEAGAVQGELSFSTGTETEKMVDSTVSRWGPETGAPTEPQLTFVVQVPEETPRNAPVWLSGNHELLGNWSDAGVELYKALGNRYATTLSFPQGTALEFKATRGSPDTVETGPSGEEVGNHTHTTVGGFERVTVTVSTWKDIP